MVIRVYKTVFVVVSHTYYPSIQIYGFSDCMHNNLWIFVPSIYISYFARTSTIHHVFNLQVLQHSQFTLCFTDAQA